jgi:hypothetical protein
MTYGAMSKRLRADLSLAFYSLLLGVRFAVVKNALDHASVFIFLAVVFSVALALQTKKLLQRPLE